MAELEERLEIIRTQVTDNGLLARTQSKLYFDAKARTLEFPPGSMVLLRTPGLTGKMKESWTGPFEVLRRVTAVNVELGLPGQIKKKCRVVHVNTIKLYHQPDCRVLRVMVVAEDPDELPLKPVLAGDQLMEAQTTQLQQILEGVEGTFRDEPGLTTVCEHHIKMGDALPIRSVPYAISPKKLEDVRKEISSLLEKGIIVPSTSQWSSPIVPLIKPDRSIRLCVDFRKLNAITEPDPYCIPLVEELIARVGEAKYLSKMDLSKGFYQVPLAEEDREKTAFVTTGGNFEFTRMPFGLRNALATFQRLVDRVLGGLEAFAAPYIDDIIIFSNDCNQRFGHIREVIGHPQQAGLTAKPAKCQWAKRTL